MNVKFTGFRRLVRCGRRRFPSGLPALFVQLRIAESNLKQASGELEAQFLATSSELESLAGLGGQFVKQVHKLVSLTAGKERDSSVFSDAIQLIEHTTRFLVGYQAKTDKMLELLRNYNAQVEQLLDVEAELQRVMLPLQSVQVLFRVESARLDAGIQQMFGSLTQEIGGLHNQVREIFGTKFKQLEQTHQTIGLVIGQLARQSQSLQQVMSTQKAQIESSLATLRKEMIANAERDSRLGQLSKDLAHEVEQIVMGLQFQDIINQKIEHVTAALPPIETKFAELIAAAGQVASHEPLQFLQLSCRLEAGQLQAAQTELAKAEVAIQKGIQRVLAQLTEIDSHSLSLDEFKLLTTSFDSMVQVLIEMIGEVRKLVAAMVTSATEAYEMLQPLGSLASDLTAVVHDISMRIHLIGLNAQVQAAGAAQDDRGAALEVLSARTSEISTETNRISQQAAFQLDTLFAGLADSVKVFGQLRTAGLTQQSLLDQRGCVEEKQLRGVRDDALQTLSTIGSSLDNIRTQAERALATVKCDHFHQVTLPELRTPLVMIADTTERWLQSQRCEVAQGDLIEGFQRNYTMASERSVFTDVTSGNRPPLVSLEQVANPEIELFDDLAADTNGEPLVPEEQKKKTAPAPEAAPMASGELGANAELF
jgi:hypothetical protein